ncbi:MAG: nucleoside triphosphate pyrophosphohydrolase [Deltaproteobacteria bacterium]|nr:nucleoside triphosphate pyrophosphohydrolase [Deltaproteobacteria bacterium]
MRPLHVERLTGLIRALRGEKGCPWDKSQTPQSMAGYLLEETYELLDAVNAGDPSSVCEELGDVLFHLLFIIDCYESRGQFDLDRVIQGITEKMTRRHPHVFGETSLETADAVKDQWQRIKAQEKKEARDSVLGNVPRRLPALLRALRVSERAAGAAFDWDDISGVMDKAEEEWVEFKAEMKAEAAGSGTPDRVALEFGDILFTLVNVARFARLNPEEALHAATTKFEKRFRTMERQITESGKEIRSVAQSEKDALWEKAKK